MRSAKGDADEAAAEALKNIMAYLQRLIEEMIQESNEGHSGDKEVRLLCECGCCWKVDTYTDILEKVKEAGGGR